MREALLIARREYLERVRSKAFLYTTLLMPILMSMLMGGSILAAMHSGGGKHIVVASPDVPLAAAVVTELQREGSNGPSAETLAPSGPADRATLTDKVENKQIDGALLLDRNGADHTVTAQYLSRSAGDLTIDGQLQHAVTRALMRTRLLRQGMAPAEVDASMKTIDIETLQVKHGKASASNSIGSFLGAYILIFLLYFTVIYYGMNVARSVIEEKTSRIFEVLLATTTPESLMAGKLMGVGAAGLTQIGIWVLLAGLVGGSSLAMRSGLSGHGISALGITPLQVIFFVVYFLLGFLFYSALSAAFGASVSSEQEIQQFTFIIVLPLVVGIVLMSYILSNPNAPAVVALSLFPPCTPIVMYLRIAAQQPPAWQLALSVLLMLLAIYAMLWVASRIYRIGILMYGKRATLPEMLRWIRYS